MTGLLFEENYAIIYIKESRGCPSYFIKDTLISTKEATL